MRTGSSRLYSAARSTGSTSSSSSILLRSISSPRSSASSLTSSAASSASCSSARVLTVTSAASADAATPVTVGPVYWYGDEAPTYTVTENKKEGAQLISINPDTGKFVANQDKPTTVTAINKQEIEKASVRIIKTLKGSSEFTREYIESLVFKFDLKVDGHEKETIVLNTPTKQNENGDWVWEGLSSEYTWLYGNNPVPVPSGNAYPSAITYEYYYDASFNNRVNTDDGIPTEVGNYYVKVLVAETDTSLQANTTTTCSIKPRPVSITWSYNSFVYTGEVQTIVAYYTDIKQQVVELNVEIDKIVIIPSE